MRPSRDVTPVQPFSANTHLRSCLRSANTDTIEFRRCLRGHVEHSSAHQSYRLKAREESSAGRGQNLVVDNFPQDRNSRGDVDR